MRGCALVFLILCELGLSAFTVQAASEDADAGASPADILEIRQLFQSVESDIAAGKLTKAERVTECGPLPDGRAIFTDATGTIRKYLFQRVRPAHSRASSAKVGSRLDVPADLAR